MIYYIYTYIPYDLRNVDIEDEGVKSDEHFVYTFRQGCGYIFHLLLQNTSSPPPEKTHSNAGSAFVAGSAIHYPNFYTYIMFYK